MPPPAGPAQDALGPLPRRDVRAGRPGPRDPPARSAAPAHVRPRRRRVPGARGRAPLALLSTTFSGPTTTACACFATSSAPTPRARSSCCSPIRPEEFAFVTEAVNLIADMDRMGVVRRLKVNRFTPAETAAPRPGARRPGRPGGRRRRCTRRPRACRSSSRRWRCAYREGGMIQQIDGVWTLARNAERMVPSAVQDAHLAPRRSAARGDQGRSSPRPPCWAATSA